MMQQIPKETARSLFAVAAVCLGRFDEAHAALTEACVAAARKSPDDMGSACLTELVRICRMRAPEHAAEFDIPHGSALRPVMQLTATGRRYLGLSLSGFSEGQIAVACGLNSVELQQKIEKATRQLTFLTFGKAPDEDALRQAMKKLPWTEDDSLVLSEALSAAVKADEEDKPAKEPEIQHRKRPRRRLLHKRIVVPVWGICLLFFCIAAIAGVLYMILRQPMNPHYEAGEEAAYPYESQSLKALMHYISMDEAQKAAVASAQVTQARFISTELETETNPPQYEMLFLDGEGKEHAYILNANNGEILSKESRKTDLEFDFKGWIPIKDARKIAQTFCGLRAPYWLKEKCSASGGESGSYKFELTDSAEKIYKVQLDAKSGVTLKFDVETPSGDAITNVIEAEQAQQIALARVSAVSADQVIFTKTKLDGELYLIAFTLDDGTQYAVELQAQTGTVKNVDVHPVSADITKAVGLLKARDTALRLADLEDRTDLRFTKAKIDRSNGTYVYELEFETPYYEYEVSIQTESGEVTKYRAIKK